MKPITAVIRRSHRLLVAVAEPNSTTALARILAVPPERLANTYPCSDRAAWGTRTRAPSPSSNAAPPKAPPSPLKVIDPARLLA
jgi:hypothetical protein